MNRYQPANAAALLAWAALGAYQSGNLYGKASAQIKEAGRLARQAEPNIKLALGAAKKVAAARAFAIAKWGAILLEQGQMTEKILENHYTKVREWQANERKWADYLEIIEKLKRASSKPHL